MSDQHHHSVSSPLMAPPAMTDPSEIDLEAGPGEQIQCRICLETDGTVPDFILFNPLDCTLDFSFVLN